MLIAISQQITAKSLAERSISPSDFLGFIDFSELRTVERQFQPRYDSGYSQAHIEWLKDTGKHDVIPEPVT